MSRIVRPALLLALASGITLALPAGMGAAGVANPELISVDESGGPADASFSSSVSSSGRYVAFTSNAGDIVTDDTNDRADVFVRDRMSGTTERVSVTSSGAQGTEFSMHPAISGNGRYVAFMSRGPLVPEDTNGRTDTYVHDRDTGETELVSVSLSGASGDRPSAGFVDVSPDGRYVAFASRATDLTSEVNRHYAVFVRDLQEGVTDLVSVNRKGNAANGHGYAPTLSADGRYVAFFSRSTNLKGAPTTGTHFNVFVSDRKRDSTRLVSVTPGGEEGDRQSMFPSISNNGRLVAFGSAATNLVPGDTDQNFDVFVRNLGTHRTKMISLRPSGSQSRRPSTRPTISPDGGFVTFTSEATLVPGETNDTSDAYLWDRRGHNMQLVSASPTPLQPGDACYANSVSRNGKFVSFQASGRLFYPTDPTFNHSDIYLRSF